MQLLTIKELMSFLKVKRNTVYELRRKGLPVIHLGRSVRFERDEVIKWVRSHCSTATTTQDSPVPVRKTNAAIQNSVIENGLIPVGCQAGAEYLL